MSFEYTVAIVKPDAVRAGRVGEILRLAEAEGLKIAALFVDTLTVDQARALYGEHEGKSFYDSLIEFTVSGRCVCALLEGDDAIARWRKLLGATDPAKAEPGTIRQLFGTGGPANAAHGSDSTESAAREAQVLDLMWIAEVGSL